jgi:hypothetical protein
MADLQGKSEVANLLAQIDAEYTATQRIFSRFTATARHDFINKRMERIDILREQIGELVGIDEANGIVCERWLALEGTIQP